MAALASLLPKPVNASVASDDEDDVQITRPEATTSQSVIIRTVVPPYGQRNGWKPSSQEDFGDGGAYPECHIAQYPLGLGKKKTAAGNTLALQVDSEGNVRYDAIAQQGQRDGKLVQSQFKDLVPLAYRKDLDDEGKSMERPSEEEVQATADKTKAALEKLVNGKIKAAQPKNVPDAHGNTSFIRYTPGQQAGSAGLKQRIIKMTEVVEDPLEPPRFKHKKIPRGPPSPPPPILRSPPRKATAAEQKEWMIPPCISNWKNNKGFTIPLDKRLAADGRGLQDVYINDHFAKFSEALFVADRHAREEVRQRALMQQKLAQKEKEAKEENLRMLAQRAREERSGIAPKAAAQAQAGFKSSMAAYGSDSESGGESESEREASEDEEDEEARKIRDDMRAEKRREREREMRMNNMGTEQRAKMLARQQNRDISEKIALGLAKPTTSKESMLDSRLFNQESLSNTFADEDAYNLYDKPLFHGSTAAAAIYKAHGSMAEGDESAFGGGTEEGISKAMDNDRFALGRPKVGFEGADIQEVREGPVQFEKDTGDVFGVNNSWMKRRQERREVLILELVRGQESDSSLSGTIEPSCSGRGQAKAVLPVKTNSIWDELGAHRSILKRVRHAKTCPFVFSSIPIMAPYTPNRVPYVGSRRKLVLAFDVGTTFSGVSYSILDPGQSPEIKGVTKFPAHEQISGASKIPTIIYYDRAGNVCAVGAEALTEGIFETAEEEEWIKAEWFKMHIRPKNESSGHITSRIPPLPKNKTVVQVLADFLVYLYKCAKNYIQETHANGKDLWDSVEKEIDFVISHPNGWEGWQQTQMREAVVLAGFIPDTSAGHARVSFVTEGEASLHFSIRNGLPTGAMEKGDGVVIVDAGGGTIDISTYSRQIQNLKNGENFEEIAAPQCHFYGSVFVSIHARLALQDMLADSEYIDDLDHIVRCFDKTTKIRFSDDKQAQYIKFGSTRDNDASVGIRFGQLKLSGEQVAAYFEPSIKCIIDAIKDQTKTAHKSISHVVLVGGFASSDWLFTQVQTRLAPYGLNVIRPEIYVNKAVSDGAISFHLDHLVKTRVSKMAYGTFRHVEYEATDPEHVSRKGTSTMMPSGREVIPDSFAVILPRNTQVSESKEYKKFFWKEGESKSELNLSRVTSEVWAYRGNNANPRWKNIDTQNYKKLCTIEMDLSHLPIRPVDKLNGKGGDFFYLEYGYILQFSAVELKAQMSWTENGIEKRSPANIIYDPDD